MLEYIKSITTDENRPMMEAAAAGYIACFESEASDEFTDRVRRAIKNLKVLQPTVYMSSIKRRLNTGMGSITEYDNVNDLEQALQYAHWEPFHSDALSEGSFGAITYDIPGLLGIIPLDDVPEGTPIVLMDIDHDDHLVPTVSVDRTVEVDHTTLIFGSAESDENNIEYMRTFHPGDPIKYVDCEPNEFLFDGMVVTRGQAKALGFDYARIV